MLMLIVMARRAVLRGCPKTRVRQAPPVRMLMIGVRIWLRNAVKRASLPLDESCPMRRAAASALASPSEVVLNARKTSAKVRRPQRSGRGSAR